MYLQALKRLYARIPTASAVGSSIIPPPHHLLHTTCYSRITEWGVETDSDWATVNILNEPLVTTIP